MSKQWARSGNTPQKMFPAVEGAVMRGEIETFGVAVLFHRLCTILILRVVGSSVLLVSCFLNEM